MLPLNAFKAQHGGDVQLYAGKNRMWGFCGDKKVVVSKECDTNKPMFVTRITEDREGNAVTDEVYVIFNVTGEAVMTL